MAALAVQEFLVDPLGGMVTIRLAALNALPIEGVMTTLTRGPVAPEARSDPAVIEWLVPAQAEKYVVYGVLTPLTNLLFAPNYERSAMQTGRLLRGRGLNPARLKTRKLNAGEWVGTPELISLRIA